MAKHNDEALPLVEDGVPVTAIRLTEAFMMVADAIVSVPSKIPSVDEEWSNALLKSREYEKTVGHDPEEFSVELEQEWHLHKVANVILRSALNDGAVKACVLNPVAGHVLQLPSEGWLAEEWLEGGYIPSGIWRDHAIPEDLELPGPAATFVADSYRSIFLDRTNFESWLLREFGSKGLETASKATRLRDAVMAVVTELWPNGIPPGINHKNRNHAIRARLKQKGCTEASDQTIRRALREMRLGQTRAH